MRRSAPVRRNGFRSRHREAGSRPARCRTEEIWRDRRAGPVGTDINGRPGAGIVRASLEVVEPDPHGVVVDARPRCGADPGRGCRTALCTAPSASREGRKRPLRSRSGMPLAWSGARFGLCMGRPSRPRHRAARPSSPCAPLGSLLSDGPSSADAATVRAVRSGSRTPRSAVSPAPTGERAAPAGSRTEPAPDAKRPAFVTPWGVEAARLRTPATRSRRLRSRPEAGVACLGAGRHRSG